MADTLLEDLGAGPFEMGAPVRFRFELVREEAVSFAGGVVRVFGGERAGPVDEVRRIYYGRWRYSFDDGAEFEEEVGFLGGRACNCSSWVTSCDGKGDGPDRTGSRTCGLGILLLYRELLGRCLWIRRCLHR